MKTLCCIGFSLLLSGNAVFGLYLPGMETPRPLAEEEIVSLREEVKNPEKLKKFLLDMFDADWESGYWIDIVLIRNRKETYSLQEEVTRPVLLEICRESVLKTRWKYEIDREAGRRLYVSLCWMGLFADETIKKFLRGIVTDSSKDDFFRAAAIKGYLYSANVQDIKDFFAHLLKDKKQFPPDLREEIVRISRDFVNPNLAGEEDEERRKEILSSLGTVAARETDGKLFRKLDEFLRHNSKEWENSSQRKAALERMNKPPETPTP